ncbi:porin family protein [Bacteroides clarus]|uniref:porin family protein n=1 Tax=Bacteroides clarus TaxID=626929 RepID=UPI003A860867|nr:porin family protein [Bacteroides sp.]
MKKLFVLVLVAMVSTVTFAQISWNAKAGINMSNFTGIDGAKMKVGYQFGVGMEYAFTDMWSVQPSLMFVGNGAKEDVSGGESINPVYLQIPIMAAARFPVSESVNIVGKVGPYLGFGLGGKYGDDKIFDKEGMDGKRFDFGLGVGAGAEFGKFLVGLDFLFGLTEVMDWGKDSPKNMSIALSVGYKF